MIWLGAGDGRGLLVLWVLHREKEEGGTCFLLCFIIKHVSCLSRITSQSATRTNGFFSEVRLHSLRKAKKESEVRSDHQLIKPRLCPGKSLV